MINPAPRPCSEFWCSNIIQHISHVTLNQILLIGAEYYVCVCVCPDNLAALKYTDLCQSERPLCLILPF